MKTQRVSLFVGVGTVILTVGWTPRAGAQELQAQMATTPSTHVMTQGTGAIATPTDPLTFQVALQPATVQTAGVVEDVAPMPIFPARRMSFEQLRRRLPYGVTQNLVIRYLGDDVEFMTHDD